MAREAESLEAKIMKKLPEGWEETMLDMYSMGASDYEVMSELRLHYDLWQRLMLDEHFREVVIMGRQDARAFWYSEGRKNLHNKDFNTSLWKAFLENRYGWSSKTATLDEEDFGKALDDAELEQEISNLSRKLRVVDKEDVKG